MSDYTLDSGKRNKRKDKKKERKKHPYRHGGGARSRDSTSSKKSK